MTIDVLFKENDTLFCEKDNERQRTIMYNTSLVNQNVWSFKSHIGMSLLFAIKTYTQHLEGKSRIQRK